MKSRSIRVERTARYCVLGDPGADWDELWFCLHGYGQQAQRFLAEFECVARPRRLLVAPEGLSRFYLRGTRGRIGASWMTSEVREDEIADYLAYLEAVRAELVSERASGGSGVAGADWREGLLGFSQGTATAGRFAALGSRAPERLILWGGGFPPDVDRTRASQALARTAIDLVVGAADEYQPPERVREADEALRALGLRPRVRSFDGGHHLEAGVLGELFSASDD